MTDYKTMYTILCKGLSDAADILSDSFVQTEQTIRALSVLETAMNMAEDIYIDTCCDSPDDE